MYSCRKTVTCLGIAVVLAIAVACDDSASSGVQQVRSSTGYRQLTVGPYRVHIPDEGQNISVSTRPGSPECYRITTNKVNIMIADGKIYQGQEGYGRVLPGSSITVRHSGEIHVDGARRLSKESSEEDRIMIAFVSEPVRELGRWGLVILPTPTNIVRVSHSADYSRSYYEDSEYVINIDKGELRINGREVSRLETGDVVFIRNQRIYLWRDESGLVFVGVVAETASDTNGLK